MPDVPPLVLEKIATTGVVAFLSIISFQACYLFFHWRIFKRREYLFYTLYLFFNLLYFSTLYIDVLVPPHWLPRFLPVHAFFKRPLAVSLYLLYYLFVIDFLEFRTLAPRIFRSLQVLIKILGCAIVFFAASYFFLPEATHRLVYLLFSLALFFASLYYIVALWRIKTQFSSYFLRGSVAAISGAFVANIIGLVFLGNNAGFNLLVLFVILSPLAGILIEVLFFSSGLAYKASQLEMETLNQKNALLAQMLQNNTLLLEKEEIRNKIAQDIHDDVGSGLSTIRMMSDLMAQQNTGAGNVMPFAQKI